MVRIKDLPDSLTCPKCGSNHLGLLRREENYILPLVEKKGKNLTKIEQKMYQGAVSTAMLISSYGKTATIALSARRVKSDDVKEILKKERIPNDNFFELVIEAERKVLKRRFWAD